MLTTAMHAVRGVGVIEIRLECRCLQKCFFIWNYYVGCLWAPLLVLTQSKETFFWSDLVFFTIKTRVWKYYSYLNMRKLHFNDKFLVLLGTIISSRFCMFKWGKNIKQNNKGCMLQSYLYGWGMSIRSLCILNNQSN